MPQLVVTAVWSKDGRSELPASGVSPATSRFRARAAERTLATRPQASRRTDVLQRIQAEEERVDRTGSAAPLKTSYARGSEFSRAGLDTHSCRRRWQSMRRDGAVGLGIASGAGGGASIAGGAGALAGPPSDTASARRGSSFRRTRPGGSARCDQARTRQDDGDFRTATTGRSGSCYSKRRRSHLTTGTGRPGSCRR